MYIYIHANINSKTLCPFCKKFLDCCDQLINQSINQSMNQNLFTSKERNTTNSRYKT